MIHRSAVIETGAVIGDNVRIGPFCFIGKKAKIANNCIFHSNVVIDGDAEIGNNTELSPFSSIGTIPQDLKYAGEKTKVVIGDNCKIREYVTVNIGTNGGGRITRVGNNCLLMVGTHIAHDCNIGNDVIFANHATLAGHVTIEDKAVIGALSAIHQFTRIGEGSMIGGMSGVTNDVIPFGTVVGNRAKLSGLNIVGLRRREIKKKEINELRKVFKYIFFDKKNTFKLRVEKIIAENYKSYTVKKLIDFLLDDSERSFCLP